MTPLQLAQAECANYTPSGMCLGLDIADSGGMAQCLPSKGNRCVLASEKACAYFSGLVLAAIPGIRDDRKVKEWQGAETMYRRATKANFGKPPPECP